jgi:hypothetical protein
VLFPACMCLMHIGGLRGRLRCIRRRCECNISKSRGAGAFTRALGVLSAFRKLVEGQPPALPVEQNHLGCCGHVRLTTASKLAGATGHLLEKVRSARPRRELVRAALRAGGERCVPQRAAA